jgi:hypothetical protein
VPFHRAIWFRFREAPVVKAADLQSILNEHGGFHDATIRVFQLFPESATIKISIDDLYSNFRGLPGYGGRPEAAELVIRYSELLLRVDMYDPDLRIFDCELEGTDHGFTLAINLAPSGTVRAAIVSFELVRSNDES